MLEQEFEWFFTTHSQTLRKGEKRGFEVLMGYQHKAKKKL